MLSDTPLLVCVEYLHSGTKRNVRSAVGYWRYYKKDLPNLPVIILPRKLEWTPRLDRLCPTAAFSVALYAVLLLLSVSNMYERYRKQSPHEISVHAAKLVFARHRHNFPGC